MQLPKHPESFFLDVGNWHWKSGVVKGARDRDAVQRYFEALDQDFLGQAIRERYAFDGQIGSDGVVGDTGKQVDELIICDLQDFLDEDDDRIEPTRVLLQQGAGNVNDPGIELVREILSMIEADPPSARRKRALRTRLLAFLEENELDLEKVDRVLHILTEE